MADNALSAIDEFIAAQSADTSGDRWRTRLAQPPQADFDAESWTPAGNDTYGRFMRIRTLSSPDCSGR